MQSVNLLVESQIDETPRVLQLSGMFDCPVSEKIKREWRGELPIDEKDWNVGLIVGASGSGKSSILRQLYGEPASLSWGRKSIIDDFDKSLKIEEITSACSAVGFNTIPSWMKPYAVLSNGEKFRADLARRLLEGKSPIVVDEFTSVVDRHVAKIAANAVQKFVRKRNFKFVAATCHYDVIEWLQPDWILEPETMTFTWRALRRRPTVEAHIQRVEYSAWSRFAPYHYLTAELNSAAQCFGVIIDNEIVCFAGVIHFPHPKIKNIKRVTRLVTHPDWQGLGLGFVLVDALGAAYKAMGYDLRTYPAHPSFVRAFSHSPRWRLLKVPGSFSPRQNPDVSGLTGKGHGFGGRPCAVFKYVGEASNDVTFCHALTLGRKL